MNVFDLVAGLTLDDSEYMRSLDNADKKGVSKLSKGLKKFGKASAVAFTAGATAITVLAKKSLSAYTQFEQLEGGVKKLYGNGAKELMNYANNAYKTSGLSANAYMQQATSFSAALINSLGGDQKKAAKQTDVAMRAISDNYNTFGGDLGMISYAFQGFAKQNYMMLDNLKLGYGGTKKEMERLIKDANEYAKANGMAANLSIDSFSDIVTAIDLIQQKQGIAGTTAKEAAKTIEGSTNMMKASWENLISGIANDDVDFGSLVDKFVESLITVSDNISPRIEKIVTGLGTLMTQLVSKMFPRVIAFITSYLPEFLKIATEMVVSIANSLVGAVPSLINTASAIIQQLLGALGELLPQLVTAIVNSLPAIMTALMLLLPAIINAIVNMVNQIAGKLPSIIQAIVKVLPQLITTLVNGLVRSIPMLIEGAIQMWTALAMAIPEAIPIIIDALPQIAEALFNGLVALIPVVLNAVPMLMNGMKEAFSSYWSAMGEMGKNLMAKLIDAIKSKASEMVRPIKEKFSAIRQTVTSASNAIRSKVASVWNNIKDRMAKPIQTAKDKIKGIIDKIKGFFPIKVGKIFTGWIPQISLKANKKKDSASTSSSVKQEKFAKAMNQPYMFNNPTFFAAGEAGDEMLYGRKALMDDISEATANNGNGDFYQTNYITVSGAENPEDFADRFIRSMKLKARTV